MRLIFSILLVFIFSNNILAQVNLNNGLVAYYPFNGNANDESGNAIHGNENEVSLVSYRNDLSNSAYYFNGTNSYISLPYSKLYNFPKSGTFTISVWIQPDENNNWPAQALVVKSPFHNNYLASMWNYGTYILNRKAMAGLAENNSLNGKTNFKSNRCWYNIIQTYDNGKWNIYVNGILEASDLSRKKFILQDGAESKITIGRKGEASGDYYQGKMDDIRIYDRVLNAAEILNLSEQTSACLTNCDKWLSTPTVGSYVTVGDLDITGNQITVEANFNRNQNLNSGLFYGHLISKHSGTEDANYTLLPNGCEITTTNGYYSTFQTCPPTNNKTYHVAMVYNGSSLKFYRNGFLLSSQSCNGNLVNNNLQTTINQYAAQALTNNQMLGFINEVRIWNVARTQEEIKAYMNKSLPNPTTQEGLKGYYVFDDLTNKQGNAKFNGKLNGDAATNATNPDCDFVADSCAVIEKKKVILEIDGKLEYNISKCNEINFSIANPKNLTDMKWQFGDNEVSFRENVTHTYRENGKYTVTLTLYGKEEQTKTITKEITIQSPTTNFSYKQIGNTLKAEFKNTTVENINYKWDFGDSKNNTNDNKTFTHEYASPGTYTVKVSAEDKMGCTTNLEKEIVIEKPKTDIAEAKKPITTNAPTFDIAPEKRINNLVRKINITTDSVLVTFYDNGIVDGDSITVKYNNKLIIQHLLINANGKSFKLKVEPAPYENELIMYAENFGSIPPNTALMIVYDGKKRYEVNLISSNTTNGKVSFVRVR